MHKAFALVYLSLAPAFVYASPQNQMTGWGAFNESTLIAFAGEQGAAAPPSSDLDDQNKNDLMKKYSEKSVVGTEDVASSVTEDWQDYKQYMADHSRWALALDAKDSQGAVSRFMIGSDGSTPKKDKVIIVGQAVPVSSSSSTADVSQGQTSYKSQGYLWQKISGRVSFERYLGAPKMPKPKNDQEFLLQATGLDIDLETFWEIVTAQNDPSKSTVISVHPFSKQWPEVVDYGSFRVSYTYLVKNSIPMGIEFKNKNDEVVLTTALLQMRALAPRDKEETWPGLKTWKKDFEKNLNQ